MVKGRTHRFRHISAGYLSLHYRELRINLTEITIEANRCRKVDRVLECHIAIVATLQDFDELSTLPLIENIEACILIVIQQTHELFTNDICLIQISVLVLTFTHGRQTGCRSIHAEHFTEFLCRLEVEVHFIWEILYTYAFFVIWRHDVDIEVTLRLSCASLAR